MIAMNFTLWLRCKLKHMWDYIIHVMQAQFYVSCVPCSQLLSDVEEHLKCTITQCEPDIKVPLDDFDGKVTYGQRKGLGGKCHSVKKEGLQSMHVKHFCKYIIIIYI